MTMLKPLVPQLTEEERATAAELDAKMPHGRSGHYDVDGTPITLGQWAMVIENKRGLPGWRHVGDVTLPNGFRVSTVWLGLDHAFGGGPPLIFESMVFHPQEHDGGPLLSGHKFHKDVDQVRYTTLEEAVVGHALMVAKWEDAEMVMESDEFHKAMEGDEK